MFFGVGAAETGSGQNAGKLDFFQIRAQPWFLRSLTDYQEPEIAETGAQEKRFRGRVIKD